MRPETAATGFALGLCAMFGIKVAELVATIRPATSEARQLAAAE